MNIKRFISIALIVSTAIVLMPETSAYSRNTKSKKSKLTRENELLKLENAELNFEIKKHNSDQKNIRCAEAVAAMLKEKGMVSQCRVMSYSTLALEKLIVKLPELKVDALGDVDPSTLIGKGYSGISIDMNTLSSHPEWISIAHENGMQVTIWTPSTVADMMTFINLGVDFMTVNSVDMAKSVIQRIYVE